MAGAGGAGEPDGRRRGSGSARDPHARRPGAGRSSHTVRAFLRANPQVLLLLVVCVVLGIGTFVVVLIGLVTAGSDQTTGEPSGAILGTHALLLTRSLVL
jgi:hypothetical protein